MKSVIVCLAILAIATAVLAAPADTPNGEPALAPAPDVGPTDGGDLNTASTFGLLWPWWGGWGWGGYGGGYGRWGYGGYGGGYGGYGGYGGGYGGYGGRWW